MMAMFSALTAEMGDWQRLVSKPSKEASIIGYKLKSSEKVTSAPKSAYKHTFDFNTIGPVTYTPAGIMTVPPPAEEAASMACWMASVDNLTPVGSAPYWRMLNCLPLIFGKVIFSILKSACLQSWLTYFWVIWPCIDAMQSTNTIAAERIRFMG